MHRTEDRGSRERKGRLIMCINMYATHYELIAAPSTVRVMGILVFILGVNCFEFISNGLIQYKNWCQLKWRSQPVHAGTYFGLKKKKLFSNYK